MIDATLFTLATGLNFGDRKMLTLTLVVSASVFVIAPRQSYEVFYLFCIFGEIAVALTAFVLRANASSLVILFCVIMAALHVAGMVLDGYPENSPYRLSLPYLEHAQLAACLFLSDPLYGKVKNHEPSPN